MDPKEPLEALHQTIDHVSLRLDQTRSEVGRLGKLLGRLSEGQEAVELQLALLSKDAEHYDSRLHLVDNEKIARAAEDIKALQQRIAELNQQVDRLPAERSGPQQSVSQPGHLQEVQADLVERTEALERAVSTMQRITADLHSSGLAGFAVEPSRSDAASAPDAESNARVQVLVDDLAALKTAGGRVLDRLVLLEKRLRRLSESLSALSLEHARRDEETKVLRQRLKKSTWLTLSAFVFAAISLAIVGWRSVVPTTPDGTLTPGKQGLAEMEHSRAFYQALANDIAQLRKDLSLVERSLATLAQKVDDFIASPPPAVPLELGGLPETVESLVAADARHTQALADLQAAQTQLQKELAKPDAEKARPKAALKTAPSDAAIAPTSPATRSGAEGSMPASEVVDSVRKEDTWEQAGAQGLYTLQLIGVTDPRSIPVALTRHRGDVDQALHFGKRAGRQWVTLLHGIYGSLKEARQAARNLPKAVLARQPWARKVPDSGRFESL